MPPASNDEAIRNQLYIDAGVKPSMNWIRSYRSNPQQQNNATLSADAMLQQILYHDLRDVVREIHVPDNGNDDSNSPSQQWRRMVQQQQSTSSATNNSGGALAESSLKATLPESFRLMIQVEEVIDVSRNAETRLGGATANSNYNNSGGGQQRCLKLCVSDGFYEPTGSPYPPNANNNNNNSSNNNNNSRTKNQAMLAMESSPIPNLTMAAKAGLKILLHGPIEVRWGVLMLHEGNALVLGGSVQALVEIQTKALEDAKREAGVGVDPTVRALIWNPDTGGEEEEDEGEQGSSDVASQPPAPMGPRIPSAPAAVPNQQQIIQNDDNTPIPQHQNNINYQQQEHQHLEQNSQAQRYTPTITPTTANQIPNNPTPPASIMTPATTSRAERSNPISSRQSQSQITSNVLPIKSNPYARISTGANGSSNSAFSTVNRSNNRPPDGQQFCSVPSQVTTTYMPTPTAAVAMVPPANRPSNIQTGVFTPSLTAGAQSRSDDVVMEDVAVSATPPASQSIDIAFGELKALLLRAYQDQTFYRQNYGVTFTVNMRQVGSHHYFNIDKVKKKKDRKREERKKGDKKYEYAIHAKFAGPTNSDDDCISCAISSDILEPYFGYSPAEMRNLNRTDREKSATHISVSGRRAKDVFQKPGLWEVTLRHSAEEFFQSPPPLDGKQPILILLSRHKS